MEFGDFDGDAFFDVCIQSGPVIIFVLQCRKLQCEVLLRLLESFVLGQEFVVGWRRLSRWGVYLGRWRTWTWGGKGSSGGLNRGRHLLRQSNMQEAIEALVAK